MHQLTTKKTGHPVDGSPRWTVSGPAGSVVFDHLGNHLALLFADGEIDAMGTEYANQARSVSEYFDDNAVFELLTQHYQAELVPAVTR